MSTDRNAANEQQDEELRALEAIYGEDCEIASCSSETNVVSVYIPDREAQPCITLRVYLGEDYPSKFPLVELHAPHLQDDDLISWATAQLEEDFIPGKHIIPETLLLICNRVISMFLFDIVCYHAEFEPMAFMCLTPQLWPLAVHNCNATEVLQLHAHKISLYDAFFPCA